MSLFWFGGCWFVVVFLLALFLSLVDSCVCVCGRGVRACVHGCGLTPTFDIRFCIRAPADPAHYVSRVKDPAHYVSRVKDPAHYVSRVKDPAHYVSRVKDPAHYVSRVKDPAHYVSRVKDPAHYVSRVKAIVKPASRDQSIWSWQPQCVTRNASWSCDEIKTYNGFKKING